MRQWRRVIAIVVQKKKKIETEENDMRNWTLSVTTTPFSNRYGRSDNVMYGFCGSKNVFVLYRVSKQAMRD